MGYDGIVFPKVIEAAAKGKEQVANEGLADVADCLNEVCRELESQMPDSL